MHRTVVLLSVISCAPALAQTVSTFLNLDFEIETRSKLRNWGLTTTGYTATLDHTIVKSGKTSLRSDYVNGTAQNFFVAGQTMPLAAVRGKKITYSGWIRTKDLLNNYPWAGLWFRADGPNGTVVGFENMSSFGPYGTNDWQHFSYDITVPTQAINVVFGVLHVGDGTAWFDGLEIQIDGVTYPQNPPVIAEPTGGQLTWLRRNAVPLRTVDAGNGFDDLQPLKTTIGATRVVGLGEATHGTSEFFRMKHRLLEFLASEMGFTIFSIEANMPEAYRLNEYVLNGNGDPKELLKGMYFWTWNTQEVLDMILWMREFNASGKGHLQFTGFDMQYHPVAAKIVKDFVAQIDPTYLDTLQKAYDAADAAIRPNAPLALAQSAAVEANAVVRYLTSHRAAYLDSASALDVDWAIQNASIVEQAMTVRFASSTYRDQMMARNIQWILDQNPSDKVVLWAHNGHITKQSPFMGSYLLSALKADYLSLAFRFHQGDYNAVNLQTNRLQSNPATESFIGTAEYIFLKTAMPIFFVDPRLADASSADSSWMYQDIEMREIGAVFVDGFYVFPSVLSTHDVTIFVDKTTPSKLLPF